MATREFLMPVRWRKPYPGLNSNRWELTVGSNQGDLGSLWQVRGVWQWDASTPDGRVCGHCATLDEAMDSVEFAVGVREVQDRGHLGVVKAG